jgi:16S rRNA (cytosine1402-N4)-methyltransferase
MNDKLNGEQSVTGGPGDHVPHQPVLYHEVLKALAPKSGLVYLDGTLGAGWHAEGILKASAPSGRLIGLDLDPHALEIAQQHLLAYQDRTIIRQASYFAVPKILKELGLNGIHGILLDLGVSSMQLDQPERGFSFLEDGPLDMRFNPMEGPSAADLINALNADALSRIIWDYGEERYARRIAKAVVKARPIHTTQELVSVILAAVPGYEAHLHPATRTFQALRIATNEELETMAKALPGLVESLVVGGRIAVISFHSLEDRIVKSYFRKESKDCICPPEQPICNCGHLASLKILTKKPVRASDKEVERNPRARSARLRIAQKIQKAQ